MRKERYLLISVALMLCLFGSRPGAADRSLTIVFGDALPPWVIPKSNAGIVLDILKDTLEPLGYTLNYIYVPYARRLKAYQNRDVDAVCDINPTIIANSNLKGYLSTMAYAYENVGVSLRERGYRFSKISDLTHHSVVAWQGAKDIIGGEYKGMADNNPRYRELPNQQLQIRMLYAGRYDVIQLDRQIFAYFRNIESKLGVVDTSQPIDIFPLFGKNENGCLFKDQRVRNFFNKQFKQLRESARHTKIFDKYTQ